jgi:hypothetical protein
VEASAESAAAAATAAASAAAATAAASAEAAAAASAEAAATTTTKAAATAGGDVLSAVSKESRPFLFCKKLGAKGGSARAAGPGRGNDRGLGTK